MDVVDRNAALLSNHEVQQLLYATRAEAALAGNKKRSHQLKNVATITYQTLRYLEGSASALQSASSVQSCVRQLQPLALTRAELLQVVNTRPTSAVEVQILVEESEERLSDQQVEQLLEVVARELPEPPSSQQNHPSSDQHRENT